MISFLKFLFQANRVDMITLFVLFSLNLLCYCSLHRLWYHQ